MRFRLRFVIGTALVVGAIVYLITTAIRSTSEYYLTVNEVAGRQAELVGQPLRVAGRVKPGSIAWDPATLTLRFGMIPIPDPNANPAVRQVSTAEPASYTVTCAGEPKPDMLADNRDVIVEGKLDSAGHITATQVLTSCPSKYKPAQAK